MYKDLYGWGGIRSMLFFNAFSFTLTFKGIILALNSFDTNDKSDAVRHQLRSEGYYLISNTSWHQISASSSAKKTYDRACDYLEVYLIKFDLPPNSKSSNCIII